MGLAAIYAEHADLFSIAAIDALRAIREGRRGRTRGAGAAGPRRAATRRRRRGRHRADRGCRGAGRHHLAGRADPVPPGPNRAADIANQRAERAVRQLPRGGGRSSSARGEAGGGRTRCAGSAPMCRPWWRNSRLRPRRAGAEMRLFLPSRETCTSPCAGSWPRSTSSRATPHRRPRAHASAARAGTAGSMHRMLPAFRATSTDSASTSTPTEHPAGHRRPHAVGARSAPRSTCRTTCAWSSSRAAGTTTPPSCTRVATPSTSRTSTRPCRCRGACSATTA